MSVTRAKAALSSSQAMSSQRRNSIEFTNRTDISSIILQELREFKKNFKKEIRDELKETRKEIKADIEREIEGLSKKMDQISKEMHEMKEELENVRKHNQELDRRTYALQKEQDQEARKLLNQEIRYREKCIKIRGLLEKTNENLLDRIIPPLANFIGIAEDTLDAQIDRIFRINSSIAKERKMPRDIIINFTNSRLRERIIQQNYEEKLIIEDMEMELFRDLPQQVLKKRQEYKFLTTLLRKKDINFRWEKVEGISLMYNQKRFKLNSIEKAREFYNKINKNLKEDNKEERSRKPQGEENPRSTHKSFKEKEYNLNLVRKDVNKDNEEEDKYPDAEDENDLKDALLDVDDISDSEREEQNKKEDDEEGLNYLVSLG